MGAPAAGAMPKPDCAPMGGAIAPGGAAAPGAEPDI